MTSIIRVALQKKVSYMRCSFYGSLFSQRLQYTFSKCIITIQDVLKKGKYHIMGKKLKYMNSITLVTLPKKFSFMRWRLFGAFSMIIAAIPKNVFFYEVEPFVSILSKYIRTLIQSVFHVVGMLYSIIDVYDLNQSIFWDTLYGENSL